MREDTTMRCGRIRRRGVRVRDDEDDVEKLLGVRLGNSVCVRAPFY